MMTLTIDVDIEVITSSYRYKSDYERSMKVYDGSDTPTGEELLEWAKRNVRPILGERTSKNGPLLYSGYPQLVIYSHIKDYSEGMCMCRGVIMGGPHVGMV